MNLQERDFGEKIAKLMPLIIREVTTNKESIFSSSEITISHINIIEFLAEKKSSSMGEIADILHLSMSASTSIVDKMVKMGYVERKRSDKDRRVVLVELDEKGKETAEKIKQERVNVFNDLFSALEVEEREEYLRLLKKIHGNIRKKYEEK